MRRAAAGELAELLGTPVIETDQKLPHARLSRDRERVVQDSDRRRSRAARAIRAGVNSGLAERSADTVGVLAAAYASRRRGASRTRVLIVFAMYLNLNDSTRRRRVGARQIARGVAAGAVRLPVFGRHRVGRTDDRRQRGGPRRFPDPESSICARLTRAALLARRAGAAGRAADRRQQQLGRRGHARADGAALLANDMHLSLRVPHIWYRARLIVDAARSRRAIWWA